MKKAKFFVSVFLSTFLISCGGGEPNQQATEENSVSQEEQMGTAAGETEQMEEEAPEFFLPSALQIGSVFQRSGLSYVEGIILSPGKVNDFTTKSEKLLALGVYSADLSYAVLNNQSQQSISTLKAVKQLSEDVGLAEVFSSADLLASFEKNLGNQDSILSIIIEIQERTDNYVDENGLKSIATTVFAGAWTEGMYMGVKATSGEDRERITGRLVEQMIILDNLIKALDYYHKDDPTISKVNSKLREIEDYFNNIEEIKNRDDKALNELKINFSDIKAIADKVVEIRKMITKA